MDFFNADISWLLFAYVVGSGFGWYLGVKSNIKSVSEAVIDSLIEEGYLKTKGHGENMEVLKHTEWCDDQASK